MAFIDDLFTALNDTCLATFGVEAQLFPQSQPGTPITITGIVKKPPMLEPFVPGFGSAMLQFFIGFTEIDPEPQAGDVLALNGTNYDVNQVFTDVATGATLSLKTKGNYS